MAFWMRSAPLYNGTTHNAITWQSFLPDTECILLHWQHCLSELGNYIHRWQAEVAKQKPRGPRHTQRLVVAPLLTVCRCGHWSVITVMCSGDAFHHVYHMCYLPHRNYGEGLGRGLSSSALSWCLNGHRLLYVKNHRQLTSTQVSQMGSYCSPSIMLQVVILMHFKFIHTKLVWSKNILFY